MAEKTAPLRSRLGMNAARGMSVVRGMGAVRAVWAPWARYEHRARGMGAVGAVSGAVSMVEAFEAHLIQEIGAVESIPLFGHEAGVADDSAQFFFAGAVVRASGGDHVLFDHDASYVVAAETQA